MSTLSFCAFQLVYILILDDFEAVYYEQSKTLSNPSVHIKIQFTPPEAADKPEVVVAKRDTQPWSSNLIQTCGYKIWTPKSF